MEPLRPADAFALLGAGRQPEAVGPFAGMPLLALLLDDDGAADGLWGLLPSLPCVVVGVGRPGAAHSDAVDVLLTEQASPPRPWVAPPETLDVALAQLARAVDAAPQAAVTLVQVLRAGASLNRHDALVLESLAYGLLQGGTAHRAWLEGTERPQHRDHVRPPVHVARDGDVAHLTLDRPEARNAYDAATRDALVDAVREAAHDERIREITLAGSGPDFCAGGDLSEFGTVPDPATGHLVRTTRSVGATLLGIRTRTTAHLHGACIGAGIEVPAFCDRVVADHASTSIRLPELAFGLIPGAGGTASIPRRIGRQRTAWLALTGRAIDAATALEWRLVDELA